MKNEMIYLATFAALAFTSPAQQVAPGKMPFPADNTPMTGDEWRLKLVTRLISLPSPVTNGVAQLHGMGDEASVDILKIVAASASTQEARSSLLKDIQNGSYNAIGAALGTQKLLTDAQVASALDIIHMAFEQPQSVTNPDDKKSARASICVLRYLNSIAKEYATKQRIAAEFGFVQSAVSRSQN
jgi:hypothetical protein